MDRKKAIIIGAGPAGITAAYELIHRTDIMPIVLEATDIIGGIASTVNYKGNRIDLGGHRFFSKSDRVMSWWQNILPVQGFPSKDDKILGRTLSFSKDDNAPDPEKTDRVLLIRNRLSRIFYLRKFFDYPVALNINTFTNLGFLRVMKIGISYLITKLFPVRNEKSLEDFFTNRFGKELYRTFFKDYTEKVWGLPCSEISNEWGAQRVKGLSLTKTVLHALRNIIRKKDTSISQKETETSLIEQFLYPKFGPGQMWEEVARIVREKGGELYTNHKVTRVLNDGNRIAGVQALDLASGKQVTFMANYVFSTMAIRDLVNSFEKKPTEPVAGIANGLMYRDFITVGLLLKKLMIKNETKLNTINNIVPDNWVYIQERDVKVGRLQVFNNWSPYMVKDQNTVWIGLEYFCNEGDNMWTMPAGDFIRFAIDELEKIGIIGKDDVLDSVCIKKEKTYPAYFGTYDRFDRVREYLDTYENLYTIGRNGMHRYNNMDHSMLTAMIAVDNILAGIKSKDNIWAVNEEEQYHEEKKE